MSVIVAAMSSPHQFPLPSALEDRLNDPGGKDRARASPTRGYHPPTTPAETAFAEGQRSSPSKSHARDEIRGAYRKQSIKVIKDVNGDVDAFLQELDAKRRALDDHIHRYIKQKEREFKFFERDMRIKYRNAGARHNPDGTLALQADVEKRTAPAAAAAAADSSAQASRPQKRADHSGLRDTKVSRERDEDLLGLFTPSFLPLLKGDARASSPQPSSVPSGADAASAPAVAAPLHSLAVPPDHALLRSNSDPSDDKQSSRPARAKLTSRTSSSGSESKNLVSALKSPLPNAKIPKRKRVSIVVGDEVVAPNDSVPEEDEHDEEGNDVNTVDFAFRPTRDQRSPIPQDIPDAARVDETISEPEPAAAAVSPESIAEEPSQPADGPNFRPTDFTRRRSSGLSSALAANRAQPAQGGASISPASPKTSEPHLFSFSDNELVAPDDSAERQSSSDAEDVAEPSPVDSTVAPHDAGPARAIATQSSAFRPAAAARPPPSLRTSSSSSSQPATPGFSKPSANADPVMQLDPDLHTPEIERNSEFGSLSSSYSFLDRTGSLGESFMERNAAELRRSGRRRTSAAAAS